MGTGGGGGGCTGDGWVSTSAIAGDWWYVGGNGTTENGGESGVVASFHGPTRSLVTHRSTTEVIQYLHYDEANTALYSVGNESFVSYWSDPCTLRQRQRVRCHTPSGFATAVSTSSTGRGRRGRLDRGHTCTKTRPCRFVSFSARRSDDKSCVHCCIILSFGWPVLWSWARSDLQKVPGGRAGRQM
jgi:hypothetical protein